MKRMIFAVLSLVQFFHLSPVSKAEMRQKIQVKPIEESEKSQLVQKTKSQLDELQAKKTQSPETLVEQARLLYWLGQLSEDSGDKMRYFENGVALMEPLLGTAQNPSPILLWSANAGGIASVKRNLDALRMLEKIEEKLLDVSKKFPGFESGAADRALASIYLSAPRFVSIGSKKKAAQHAHTAFERDPRHPGNMLLMAKILDEEGDEEKARHLLKEVLISAVPEKYPLDYAAWRTEALEELDAPKGFELEI